MSEPTDRIPTSFGLDLDDTYTNDPVLWNEFIKLAISRGHKVWIVTCRRDTPENREDVFEMTAMTGLKPWQHVFTNLGPKKDHCERHGIRIDNWIDDDPACILRGK